MRELQFYIEVFSTDSQMAMSYVKNQARRFKIVVINWILQ